MKTNIIYNEDCLTGMNRIEAESVDLILCDLPYGVSWQKWDSVIPIEKLWAQYRRLIKFNGAIVLFGTQPFSSLLIVSNLEWFKYEWVWEKGRASGFLHVKNKPMKAHENILVFSPGTTVHKNQSERRMTYNPQMTEGTPYTKKITQANTGAINHPPSDANLAFVGTVNENSGTRYPRSVIYYSMHNVGNIHPTQKPVDLFEYLIKTYTEEGQIVLDNCMGSGTTAIACLNTNRKYIGFENNTKIFTDAMKRIAEHEVK